jgi:hypothetical protein
VAAVRVSGTGKRPQLQTGESMAELLSGIRSPADVKRLTIPQLTQLAEEIRERLIVGVSKTG